MPLAVSLVGDVMIAAGFLIVFLTFRENTFTAGTIDAEGQHVIDSGPYAIVRHDAGALVMIVGVPLALGSWWGLHPAALLVPVVAWLADTGNKPSRAAFFATRLASRKIGRSVAAIAR